MLGIIPVFVINPKEKMKIHFLIAALTVFNVCYAHEFGQKVFSAKILKEIGLPEKIAPNATILRMVEHGYRDGVLILRVNARGKKENCGKNQ